MSSGPASAFESETFGQDASFHLEQPIGAASISPSGRDVALASKEGLHIVDLDSPYSPPRHLPHRTPWEVADVQWSPFAARDYWIVSTSNQKALVWNLAARGWQDTIEFVLHAHTRAITDINFSAHNPDILATCAVDSFVHCWDLRIPIRPAFSFSDWFAGATQVKWSRQDEHVVASSHDRFLHIWDKRNGAYPVRTIEAHGTKIYGIDWNRFHPNKIVTCSLDRTIKFWDCDVQEDVPERVIETSFPVWRARHTPFGWGLMAMPQRGSNDLFLYDRRPIGGVTENGHVRPVAMFSGHEGQVKEFLWRARGTIIDGIDHRDFQLISWGSDRKLRLHSVEPETFEGIGYEKGKSEAQRLNFTRRGARYRTFRDLPEESISPVDTHHRDGLPFSNQFLASRQRNSTSVGMSKLPVTQFRGWAAGARQTSRIGMHGRTSARNDIDPIAWLKNVKIASWDPDALAEEIRHVGEKFKRVEFETVDIHHRKVLMSLPAPWGEQHSSVYLRIDIRFPKTYPRGARAHISIQKTSALAENVYNTLVAELQKVSEIYASRQRGCLEAVLRYILREQSLDQIVNWILGESLTDSKLLDTEALVADDSSDSDDDRIEGLGSAMAASANVRVPFPKACGALWSDNGKLICFFPPRSKEPASVLGHLSNNDTENSQSNKLFEGFGRLHTSSPARRATDGTKTVENDSDSETSDSLLGSSSSSSSSSEPETEIHDSLRPYSKGIVSYLRRSQSPMRSNRSTTVAGIKLEDGKPRTVVSIHDLSDMLPANERLAKQYKIFGEHEDVCKHNAEVATNVGRHDLASVWFLSSMILSNTIPLELAKHPINTSEPDILVLANRANFLRTKKNNTLDLRTSRTSEGLRAQQFGQLRWGASPLAAAYLVPAMFDYFERVADIQMLAMLSCVFAEVPALTKSSLQSTGTDSGRSSKVGTSRKRSYYPSMSIAKSLLQPNPVKDEYIMVPRGSNSNMAQRYAANDQTAEAFTKGNPRRRPSRTASAAIDENDFTSPNSLAVSLSSSPEGNRHSQRASTGGAYSTAHASLSALTQSYSSSPPVHSSTSGAASSLKKYSPSSSLTPGWVASGLFGGSVANRSARTLSHSEAMQNERSQNDRETSLRSSASLAYIRGLRRDGKTTPDASHRSIRSLAPSEASDIARKQKFTAKRKTLKTSLHNQDCFDVDGFASTPLLNHTLQTKCRNYRSAYAQILEVWQLHIQRAEILKFNGVISEETLNFNPSERRRRKTFVAEDIVNEKGLEIRRCCCNCSAVLAAIEKNGIAIGWHCINPSCLENNHKLRASKQSICSMCYRSVHGLSVPCLNCGHLTCYECASEWFGGSLKNKPGGEDHTDHRRTSSNSSYHTIPEKETNPEAGEAEDEITQTCPTGCGCTCATLLSINAPYPAPPAAYPNEYGHPLQTFMTTQSTSSNHDILPRLSPFKQRIPMVRTISTISSEDGTPSSIFERNRLMSESHATATVALTDPAINAFVAQARGRSKSVSKPTGAAVVPRGTGPVNSNGVGSGNNGAVDDGGGGKSYSFDNSDSDDDGTLNTRNGMGKGHVDEADELNPWAGIKIASLGRGIGGGLSRGLSSKGSSSTIRKL